MTRLLLVRHGETAWNAQHRFQGAQDIPLNREGRRQVRLLAERLRSETVDAMYASDLQRAWKTAEMIAAPRSLAIVREPRLREITFGKWEGQTRAEIEKDDPQRLASWNADPVRHSPPGGESLAELTSRVKASYTEIMERHPTETVVLVAHGVTLRVLVCAALEISPRAYWRFRLHVASLSEITTHDEGAVIEVWNDTSHLDSAYERQQRQKDEAAVEGAAVAS